MTHTLVCSAFAPGAEERGGDEADVAQSAQNTDSHVWFWKKILGCAIKTSMKRLEVAAVVCIRDAEGLKRGSGGNDGGKKTERALGFLGQFAVWSRSAPLPCAFVAFFSFLPTLLRYMTQNIL